MTYRVPLVRATFPEPSEFIPRWQHVTALQNQHTNRGLIWQEARRKLESFAGGTHHALPVSSGFAALVLAARMWNENLIDVEEFTFYAAKQAVRAAGSIPCNSAEEDYQEDEKRPQLMTKWWGYDRQFDVHVDQPLIIDAAGGFGKNFLHDLPKDAVVCVSFHATKNFPIGEGGAVFVPKDGAEILIDEIDSLHRFGVQFGVPGEIPERAFNFKMDELHASMLLAQLDNWQFFRARSYRIGGLVDKIRIAAGGGHVMHNLQAGSFASLPVVSLFDSSPLIELLRSKGFEAKRSYDIHQMNPKLLKAWQMECVAFPADMNLEEELELLLLVKEFYENIK